MDNTLSIPRGVTQQILIPVTNPDGSIYPLTSMVTDIKFMVKVDAMDPDTSSGTLGLAGYIRGAVITKGIIAGGITITNAAAGQAVISLTPADTNSPTFNTLVPLDDVVYLYWGCKLYLTGGVEYDLLQGAWGSLVLNQGGIQN